MNPIFEPANLLEIALKKAADDPASRPLFFRELLDSKVLIISAGDKPRIVNGVIPQDTKIGIANIEFGGRPCVPFFTSETRLPAGTEYLMLDAKALFEITRGTYLVMNPGLAYGKEFFPDEVAGLLDGTIFEPQERYVAKKAMQVLIGQPKEYPQELVEALSRLYASHPVVNRAWVAFYHNPERDAEGGLLIALDIADPKDMERVSGESGILIGSVPKKQKFVDLIRYENSGVADYFTNQRPFYQKSVFKSLWSKIRR
jgi:hypothetical protein